MSQKIILTNVRLSFPALFKPEAFGEQEPKYGATLLMDKEFNKEQIEALRRAMNEACKERWGSNIPRGLKSCLHDGDEKDESKYAGYHDNMYIRASSKRRPQVVNRDHSPITDEDGIIYAGCFVNVGLEIWSFENTFGKGVGAWLQGVQFVRDGEPFGARFDVSEFPKLEQSGASVEQLERESVSLSDGSDLPF